MTHSHPPRPRQCAAIHGVLFGTIIALASIANTFVQWKNGAYAATFQGTSGSSQISLSDTGVSSLLGCVGFLVLLALTFWAGALTVRRTGTVGSGAVAGLVAGGIGAFVGSAVSCAIIVTQVVPTLRVPAGSAFTLTQAQSLLIDVTLAGAAVGTLLDIGFGASMGALGGLAGLNSYRRLLSDSIVPFSSSTSPSIPSQARSYSTDYFPHPNQPQFPPPWEPPTAQG